MALKHVLKSWVLLRLACSKRESREDKSSAGGFVELVAGRWSSPLMVSAFSLKARATPEEGG